MTSILSSLQNNLPQETLVALSLQFQISKRKNNQSPQADDDDYSDELLVAHPRLLAKMSVQHCNNPIRHFLSVFHLLTNHKKNRGKMIAHLAQVIKIVYSLTKKECQDWPLHESYNQDFDSFWTSLQTTKTDHRETVLRLLQSQNCIHIFLVADSFDIRLKGDGTNPPDVPDDVVKYAYSQLISQGWARETAAWIVQHGLDDFCDWQQLVRPLLISGHVDSISSLIRTDSTRRREFYTLASTLCSESFTNPQLKSIVKLVTRVMRSFSESHLLPKYPAIYVRIQRAKLGWVIYEIVELIKLESEGYPFSLSLYDCYIDMVECVLRDIDRKEVLSDHKVLVENMKREGLESLMSNKWISQAFKRHCQTRLHIAGSVDSPYTQRVPKAPSLSIYKLPNPFVLVDCADHISLVRAALSDAKIIALDCEWPMSDQGDGYGLSLIQLCLIKSDTSRNVYILDVYKLEHDSVFSILKSFFTKPNLILLGFDLASDMQVLRKTFPNFPVTTCQVVDLKNSHPTPNGANGGQSITTVGKSLGDLARETLGRVMDKRPRFSDWGRRPLRPIQLQYAASDATVLVDIYDTLVSK